MRDSHILLAPHFSKLRILALYFQPLSYAIRPLTVEDELEARILAVADVVEAMASPRPYRPACGIDKALEEISRNQGILYDPMVAEACLQLYAERN